MKINIKILLLFFGLFVESIAQCSLYLSKSNASFVGSPDSYASLNGLTPAPTPKKSSRDATIAAIHRYDEQLMKKPKGSNNNIQVLQQDDRQPQSGTTVKGRRLSGLFNSFRFDWKQEFYNKVGYDGLGFIYQDIDQDTMQAHIDCVVDKKSLRVLEKQSENSVRWFAAITVREVAPGVYQTDIEMPSVRCFADVSGTQFLPGQMVSYTSDRLPDSHLIARLSPLHAIYGE